LNVTNPHKLNAQPMEILSRIRDQIHRDFIQKTPASKELYARANSVLPGGVSGNLRFFPPYPLYMSSGSGCIVTDVDANDYIDCFSANGPMLLGHNHPEVVEAISSTQTLGSLPLNPEVMIECAELLTELVPCAEQVRFLNTGTEAVMTAIRIARGFKNKDKIIKFHGHYHGQQDQFLFGMDTTDAMFSDGVPRDAVSTTLIHRYNDIDAVRSTLESDDEVAAVILDPAMHAGGLWGSSKEFLEKIRALTSKHGVLLIFDEVITGFRLGTGGAQAYFDVTPDLVTMAKALGAGEKIAIVAGSREVMSVLDPNAPAGTPRVFQSGTVNDGAPALAACVAAMRVYTELEKQGEYEHLFDRTERLQKFIESAFTTRGLNCQANRVASMLQLYINPVTVDFESAGGVDYVPVELFYTGMINEGVLLSLPTSNHIYMSFAHEDKHIDLIESKVEKVLDKYGFDDLAIS